MFIGAATPGPIGEFVIIDGGDQGQGGMHGLQIRIAMVLIIATAVICQGFALMQRLKWPADVRSGGLAGGGGVGGFVDVIAQVQKKLDVVPGRQGAVGIEKTCIELAAGGLGKAQMGDAYARKGAGAAAGGGLAEGVEPKEVAAVRSQASGIGMHRMVTSGAGEHLAAGHDGAEGRVGGHLVVHRHHVVAAGDPGPEDHPILEGITAGEAMLKDRRGRAHGWTPDTANLLKNPACS